MLSMRAWELRTAKVPMPEGQKIVSLHNFSFRQMEKIMLYLTKHITQWLVLVIVKYWFIVTTKTKKWFLSKWPQIHEYFQKKKEKDEFAKPRNSFVRQAVIESKIKIRRIKERVKKEHGQIPEVVEVESEVKKEEN